ncbi:hypothetical protein BDR26DRAFT_849617 [Obelidium mucronatum]|nr:hypothetical protein BDR26DRAFT_849617 [Obelidium mucronatum]
MDMQYPLYGRSISAASGPTPPGQSSPPPPSSPLPLLLPLKQALANVAYGNAALCGVIASSPSRTNSLLTPESESAQDTAAHEVTVPGRSVNVGLKPDAFIGGGRQSTGSGGVNHFLRLTPELDQPDSNQRLNQYPIVNNSFSKAVDANRKLIPSWMKKTKKSPQKSEGRDSQRFRTSSSSSSSSLREKIELQRSVPLRSFVPVATSFDILAANASVLHNINWRLFKIQDAVMFDFRLLRHYQQSLIRTLSNHVSIASELVRTRNSYPIRLQDFQVSFVHNDHLGISINIVSMTFGTVQAKMIEEINNSSDEPTREYGLLLVSGSRDLQEALFQWFHIEFNVVIEKLSITPSGMETIMNTCFLCGGIEKALLGAVCPAKNSNDPCSIEILLNNVQLREFKEKMSQIPPTLPGIANVPVSTTSWVTLMAMRKPLPKMQIVSIKTAYMTLSSSGGPSITFEKVIPVKVLLTILSCLSNV